MPVKPLLNEDWSAVAVAFLMIVLASAGLTASLPSFSWTTPDDLAAGLATALGQMVILLPFGMGAIAVAFLLQRHKINARLIPAYLLLFIALMVAQIVTGHSAVKSLGLEIVLFSLFIGLAISNLLRVPVWLKPLIQTELYIKTGLVLLGCSIIFGDLVEAGALGLIQSLVVVLVVWQVCFWIGKKFGLDDELRTMLSSAVAICGVSAAIATAGAIRGDSKKLSYVISLVLIVAIPMMLIMPYIARVAGMSAPVAGAWLGGTIDTTGAVVAAGTLLGDVALRYATVVKFSQNVLLGLAAFAISIYWTYTKREGAEKPSIKVIWERFPKFVVGFVAASLLFSFVLPDHIIALSKGPLKGLQTFWFALAFICIGLETRFADIFNEKNARPAYAFLLAQLFNIFFTLLVAWVVFGE